MPSHSSLAACFCQNLTGLARFVRSPPCRNEQQGVVQYVHAHMHVYVLYTMRRIEREWGHLLIRASVPRRWSTRRETRLLGQWMKG